MKEFESTFEEGLKKGLRRHHSNSRNSESLLTCLNAKPSESGLIPITPLLYLVTNPLGNVSWPVPQIFRFEI